nr:MAG TPA: hypothetical protein [Caudoviricetes sp.]
MESGIKKAAQFKTEQPFPCLKYYARQTLTACNPRLP